MNAEELKDLINQKGIAKEVKDEMDSRIEQIIHDLESTLNEMSKTYEVWMSQGRIEEAERLRYEAKIRCEYKTKLESVVFDMIDYR